MIGSSGLSVPPTAGAAVARRGETRNLNRNRHGAAGRGPGQPGPARRSRRDREPSPAGLCHSAALGPGIVAVNHWHAMMNHECEPAGPPAPGLWRGRRGRELLRQACQCPARAESEIRVARVSRADSESDPATRSLRLGVPSPTVTWSLPSSGLPVSSTVTLGNSLASLSHAGGSESGVSKSIVTVTLTHRGRDSDRD